MSALFILQTFCRQDGGIAIPPFAQHHIYASLVKGEVLSPKRIRATTGGIAFLPHPFRFSDTSVNNPSIVGSASHCNRSSPLHKGAKSDTALPTLPKLHYPSPRTKLASPRKRVRFCCSVKPSQLWWGLNLIELLSLKLQSIRSATIRPAPTLPKPHYPSLRTAFLPYERSACFASLPRQPLVPLHRATALRG